MTLVLVAKPKYSQNEAEIWVFSAQILNATSPKVAFLIAASCTNRVPTSKWRFEGYQKLRSRSILWL